MKIWMRSSGCGQSNARTPVYGIGSLPGRAEAHFLERFSFEKSKTRGGDTTPHGQKRAEKPRFFRETTGRMV